MSVSTTSALFSTRQGLEEKDIDLLASLYAEDAILEDTATGEKRVGPWAIKAYYGRIFSIPGSEFSQIRSYADMLTFEGGNFAALEWIWSGHKRDGGLYRIRGTTIMEIGDGQIIRQRIYYDPTRCL